MTDFLNQAYDFLRPLLGLGEEPKSLDTMQVTLRALIVFAAAIAIIRVADNVSSRGKRLSMSFSA